MEKSAYTMEKVGAPLSQVLPIRSVLLHFPDGKLMWKSMHFPFQEVCHRMGNGWGKIIHTKEKYEYQFPMFTPYHGFCCIFPYCGKFMGKPIQLHTMNSEYGEYEYEYGS